MTQTHTTLPQMLTPMDPRWQQTSILTTNSSHETTQNDSKRKEEDKRKRYIYNTHVISQ